MVRTSKIIPFLLPNHMTKIKLVMNMICYITILTLHLLALALALVSIVFADGDTSKTPSNILKLTATSFDKFVHKWTLQSPCPSLWRSCNCTQEKEHKYCIGWLCRPGWLVSGKGGPRLSVSTTYLLLTHIEVDHIPGPWKCTGMASPVSMAVNERWIASLVTS